MRFDLKGKIKNTEVPISKPLFPLFEAIVNSIQAIEERFNDAFAQIKAEGEISVHINSVFVQQSVSDSAPRYESIEGFDITDNGCGFNNKNYNSFDTSDSTFKISKGGKGVGRFDWLVAFDHVEIVSNYKEFGDNHYKKRIFKFSLDDITENQVLPSDTEVFSTLVSLNEFNTRYSDKAPKHLKSIANAILDHFLAYFILERCPRITVKDDQDSISLDILYKEKINGEIAHDKIDINGKSFELISVKYFDPRQAIHRLVFCADHREVDDVDLRNYIGLLNKKIIDDKGNEFVYAGYLLGQYLNDTVNLSRTNFSFGNEKNLFTDVTKDDLVNNSTCFIKNFLGTYFDDQKAKNKNRVTEYIIREKPIYRPLLKYKTEQLEEVMSTLPDDKLDIELYKLMRDFEHEVAEKCQEYINAIKDPRNKEKYKQSLFDYINEMNDIGKTSLARYIVHRKVVLELLIETLNLRENDDKENYQLEKCVHELVCPLKYTSDQLTYEQMNLWLIDERLSYHSYLASDLEFRQITDGEIDSRERPDTIIYDNPLSFSDAEKPKNSITIIEFKRPGRDDYNWNNYPKSQVIDYIEKIKKNEGKNYKGRPITFNPNMMFDCYIICDLAPSLRALVTKDGFTAYPDGEGYYCYIDTMNAHIKVVSFDKMVADSKMRNEILFHKLFKPDIEN